MEIVNIHQAKTHLSRLIERAARGEPFVIAKAGRPMVKVIPLAASARGKAKRLGFLSGALQVPADFDSMGQDEIDALFGGKS